ncbi:sulfurtransferase TusA family protein [Catenovulum adriaticum]|uniref:Sulfurtransferase TusA family protein n=1 Tax=Catenovulum adriaticum TaxID=2984846 RepID=A0ABY7AHK3_9ALTE|nr:sulfurtransferase TusA family protein [Catenovulum sp. TS8]WAJ69093.1 sulfurtransferase TusA family protein [Catenovulum sp. TS8]
MLFNLDTQGLVCPMPLLKLKLLLKQCHSGDTIEQLVTDKTSVKDIPAWLENKGYGVQINHPTPSVYCLVIKVNANSGL